MNIAVTLNEDQRDCLKELSNIAMGAAAESLADLTNTFVCLPIPNIHNVDTSQLFRRMTELHRSSKLSIVSQMCKVDGLDFCALIIVDHESLDDLALSAQREIKNSRELSAFLLELSTTINQTCFDNLGEMFGSPIEAQALNIESINDTPHSDHISSVYGECQFVTVEINYHLEAHPFNCELLLLFNDSAVPLLAKKLDYLLG